MSESILNETDLVQGLRKQNPVAVQHLCECWLPSVWRFVYVRVGGDQHLTEDIVSETVLALIKAAGKPEAEINNPGGWLRTVAGNKVNDHFRAAARVQHLIDQALINSETREADDPAGQQELEEQRTEVRGVMDTLPEQHRIALEWKYIERLSVREIAGRMSLTEKAVESLLFRARREFRDGMKHINDGRTNCSGKDENERQIECDDLREEKAEEDDDAECSPDAQPVTNAVKVD